MGGPEREGRIKGEERVEEMGRVGTRGIEKRGISGAKVPPLALASACLRAG